MSFPMNNSGMKMVDGSRSKNHSSIKIIHGSKSEPFWYVVHKCGKKCE